MAYDEKLAARVRRALTSPHGRPFDFTGKPMKGMAMVAAKVTSAQRHSAGECSGGGGELRRLAPAEIVPAQPSRKKTARSPQALTHMKRGRSKNKLETGAVGNVNIKA